ncbi:semaphorin-1A-like [Centruroides sculpturatus]|uniref:semaphorin-1A-like n=1 Tax=Centruroides sculpturatus TaxID=218467 RepID=UPI000C6DDEB8|nr:semaphorin-1A-like [Centruroides sculpturatus]
MNCYEDEGVMIFRNGEYNPHEINYFKILYTYDEMLIIGGRNKLYNINVKLLEEDVIEWRSEEKNQYVCIQNHNPADECHNYLRVFVEVTLEIFLICGTNAYDPTCREYLISNGEKKVTEEFSARGICPYSPHFNVTSLEANGLFTATYEWDYGPYPIISKKTLQPNIQIRTPHKHLSHLSERFKNAISK